MLAHYPRRWPNINPTFVQCLKIFETNVGLMLAHRRERRPNINPTLVQCLVFAGYTLIFEAGVLG